MVITDPSLTSSPQRYICELADMSVAPFQDSQSIKELHDKREL